MLTQTLASGMRKTSLLAVCLLVISVMATGCGDKTPVPSDGMSEATAGNDALFNQFHEYEGDTGTFRDWLFADMYYEVIWGEDYFLPYSLVDTKPADATVVTETAESTQATGSSETPETSEEALKDMEPKKKDPTMRWTPPENPQYS